MSRNWWRGLAVVSVTGLGLLLAITPAPAEPPSELVKQAIKTWQTRPDLKPYADFVDKQIGETPAKTEEPGKPGVGLENAKGYAIHIACEKVDPSHYPGSEVSDLPATINDLNAMIKLSASLKYEQFKVMWAGADKEADRATCENVLKALKDVGKAAKGKNRDIVLVTYSGHGARMWDDSGDADEADGRDDTWCLYDGMLIDDHIWNALQESFEEGVRVVFVLDSCHSGTATRGGQLTARNFETFMTKFNEKKEDNLKDVKKSTREIVSSVAALKEKSEKHTREVGAPKPNANANAPKVRTLPPEVVLATYAKNQEHYKEATSKYNKVVAVRDQRQLKASVITLGACDEPQTALDLGAASNGLFTRELLTLWKDGAFDKDYNEFHKQVKEAVSTKALDPKFKDEDGTLHRQDPQIRIEGGVPSFDGQKLFRIK